MHGSSLASIMSHHHDLVNFFRVSCVSNFDVSLWNISKPCKSTSFWGSNFAIAMVSDKVVIQTQISAFFFGTLHQCISYLCFLQSCPSLSNKTGRSSPQTTSYLSRLLCLSDFSFQSGIPCSRNTALDMLPMSIQLLGTFWKKCDVFSCKFRLWLFHHDPRPALASPLLASLHLSSSII